MRKFVQVVLKGKHQTEAQFRSLNHEHLVVLAHRIDLGHHVDRP